MRTTLPIAITFALGILLIVEFFVPHAGLKNVTAMLQEWAGIIASCAFVLGAINVVQVNAPKIRRRERDWPFKLALLVSGGVMLVLGFVAGGKADGGSYYGWAFNNVFAPANATMFALLAFFIASAAFRAFRARNLEATLMLTAAIVVMLGVIPLGEKIPLIDATAIKDWVLQYANNAGRRAILVGAALGGVATGMRIILGLERSHLGGD